MAESNYLLELSTLIDEPELFTIDGAEYKLFRLEHLNEVQEAEVLALFAQHMRLSNELQFAINVAQGEKVAKKLREIRVRILSILTSVPKKDLEGFNVQIHAKMMEMAEKVIAPEEEETDVEDDEL